MGKQMNRFLSANGGTGGLVREQQRTNELLEQILAELKKTAPDRPAPQLPPVLPPPVHYAAAPGGPPPTWHDR